MVSNEIYNDGVYKIVYNSSDGMMMVLNWKVYKNDEFVEKFFNEMEARNFVKEQS